MTVAIGAGEKPEAVKRFVEKHKLSFAVFADPLVWDENKQPASKALSVFGTKGVPFFAVIDRRGKVAALGMRSVEEAKNKAKNAAK